MSCTTYHAGNIGVIHSNLQFRPLRPVQIPCQSRKKIKKEIEKAKKKENTLRNRESTENQNQEFEGSYEVIQEMIQKDYETKRFCESRGFCCHCGNRFGGEYDVYRHLLKNKICGSWDSTVYRCQLTNSKVKVYASFLYNDTCDSCRNEFDGIIDLEKHKASTECGFKSPELILSRVLNLCTYIKSRSYFSSYKFHSLKIYKMD